MTAFAATSLIAAWVGSSAWVADASYEIYVTNEISGDLSVINGSTLKVDATVPLGKRPRGIEATPDGKYLFVALSGSPIAGLPSPGGARKHDDGDLPPDRSADGIGQFDIAARKLVKIIRGVSDPEKLAVTPNGKRIFVTSEDTGTVVVLDAASGKTIASANVGDAPEGVRINPDGRTVWVTSKSAQQVSVIDIASNRVLKQIKVGQRPRSIAFTPDGAKAYVPGELDGSITVIDTKKLEIKGVIRLEGEDMHPMDSAVSPDGRSLYLSTGQGKQVIHVDTRIDKVLRKVTVGARPWGLAVSPDGRRIFSANGPSNDVSVIDADWFKVIATLPVGKGPWGIAVARRPSN
ncbi:MAG: beta-propeller fold lactonase family protein [Gammaproteobacteria bacterium]